MVRLFGNWNGSFFGGTVVQGVVEERGGNLLCANEDLVGISQCQHMSIYRTHICGVFVAGSQASGRAAVCAVDDCRRHRSV